MVLTGKGEVGAENWSPWLLLLGRTFTCRKESSFLEACQASLGLKPSWSFLLCRFLGNMAHVVQSLTPDTILRLTKSTQTQYYLKMS